MLQSTTPIEVLEQAVVWERTEQGLMTPMHGEEGLRVLDCSDDRGLTIANYMLRVQKFEVDISPARYFGAATGLAAASLITFAAEHGDQAVSNIVRDYSVEGFVDYASDLSNRAHLLSEPIDLNQHSADANEENYDDLADHTECDNPLGCAFATKFGGILLGASQAWQVSEAHNILSEIGTDLPIDKAVEGAVILQRHIPEGFGIHRGALHHAKTKKRLYTPIAIHEGQHAPNEQAALVIDMAGYRSNANRHNEAELPRYHHTPDVATEVLSKIMPEIKLDPKLLAATGLLLATSTRLALSGVQTPEALRIEVIPAEYAQAA